MYSSGDIEKAKRITRALINTFTYDEIVNGHELSTLYRLLYNSSEYGHIEIVKLLLEAGIDPDKRSRISLATGALHYGCQNHNIEIVKVLLRAGANVDLTDNLGRTPLHYASNYCYQKIIKLLLSAGANPNVVDNNMDTPLHYTSKRNIHYSNVHIRISIAHTRIEIAKSLLEAGANMNSVNKNGNTPLHQASLCGNTTLVKLLLDMGADVNVINNDNITPIRYGTPVIVKLILYATLYV